MSKGWRNESHRHSLARRGIETKGHLRRDTTKTPMPGQSVWAPPSSPISREMIDPEAYESIVMLNRLGLETIACCEGHPESGGGKIDREAYISYQYNSKNEPVEHAMERAGWVIAEPVDYKDFWKYNYDPEKRWMIDERKVYFVKAYPGMENRRRMSAIVNNEQEKDALWRRTEEELSKV